MASIDNNLGIALAKRGIKTDTPADLKRAITFYLQGRSILADIPDTELEPLLVSNLADAYYDLSGYEDSGLNLDRARNLLIEALSLRGAHDYPAVRGEIIFKLGQVDVAAGGLANNAETRRGIQEWACAFDIFDKAGRDDQVGTVLRSLKRVSSAIVQRSIGDTTPPLPDCHWDTAKLLQRLAAT